MQLHIRKIICAIIAVLWVFPNALIAQENEDARAEYSVRATVDAPVDDIGTQYRSVAARARVNMDVLYVSELEGDLAGTQAKSQPVANVPRERRPMSLNGFGVVLAVGLLVAALFLWLKFGGGGMLLAREPREEAGRKHTSPAAWNLGDAADKDANSLLAQIAQMTDRTAAMILLLRHCLLAAARATDARFARSDTERLAFARLPQQWAHIGRLETMLKQTELAHYGGRPVAEDRFSEALDSARNILTSPGAKRGQHV